MPGAEMGRAPSTRSSEWMLVEEITRGFPAPEMSAVTISDKARPAQPREASPLRFSRRRTARRSTGGPPVWRMQPVKSSESRSEMKMGRLCRGQTGDRRRISGKLRRKFMSVPSLLKNTRLQGEQLLEFGQLAQ